MHDMVVVGGGPGGYAAAIRASQLGRKVILVEAGELGGVCVNQGCIPTKVWLRAAYLLHLISRADKFGIRASVEGIDLAAIVSKKNGVVNDISMGMKGLLGNNGVKVIRGRAAMKSPREVDVDGTLIEGEKVILATGSRLDMPNIPGLEEAALTTDQVIDMTEIPSSVLILGSGSIEAEMATLFSIFGSKVYLVFDHERILPREDSGTSQRMTKALKDQKVEIFARFKLKLVRKTNDGFETTLSGSDERTVTVKNILVCARKPNTDNLGLDRLGIRLNEDGGIWVNERLETSAKGVYAIGDVTGGWMLSHVASSMAVTAAENTMGKMNKFPFHLIPRGIWTIPEVGAVGLSEDEAEKQGIKIQVGNFPYTINGLAMVRDEMTGSVKIISNAHTGEIVGVHIVGTNATELVGEAVLAMKLESTVGELANSIRVHPTFSEAIVDSARDVLSWALYLPKR